MCGCGSAGGARDHVGVAYEGALGELIDRITDLDRRYEDALFVNLDAVSTAAERVSLSLSVIQDGEVDSRWTIHVNVPLESRLSLGQHWDVNVERDHPLLIDFIDDGADLYFVGPVTDSAALIGDLVRAHPRRGG